MNYNEVVKKNKKFMIFFFKGIDKNYGIEKLIIWLFRYKN